jgi:hypothetical protein
MGKRRHFESMSTVMEIEKALPALSTEDLLRVDGAVEATLRTRRKVFTGHDAVRWWESRERMTVEDAGAFAADVEAGRREANRPPAECRWE